MELAAKRYVRWVILIHFLLLSGVVALVYSAASRTYHASQALAVQQASRVQMLLAEQTQRGIEGYYESIVNTLQLFRWLEQAEQRTPNFNVTARTILAPSIWEQLKNRASHFAAVNLQTGAVGVVYPVDQREAVEQVVQQHLAWFQSIDQRGISPFFRMGDRDVNLVFTTGSRRMLGLVAIVPIASIEQEYLQNVHTLDMSAMIFDQDMRVISAFDKEIVGLSMTSDAVEGNDKIKEAAGRYVQLGIAGTEIIDRPFRLGAHEFERGIVSIRPMNVLGTRLWLTIGSDLSSVEAVLHATYRESLLWGIFLIVSMTVILASTSGWLIRNRVAVERMRREVLTRELDQARKIQLAWLPRNDQDPPHVDLCAVNKPASHISGDFYNWFDLSDGRVCVVIGDVTGHGMAGAFLMATTQLLVRMTMPHSATAGQCLQTINYQLCNQVFSGQFVTMQILVLDRAKHKLEAATAGHPPPIVRRNGRFEPLAVSPQLVMGIEKERAYTSEYFDLPVNASLLMYTDGVTEARSPGGDWLGMERLCESLNGRAATAQELADEVVKVVDLFRGDLELADDLTLVAIQLDSGR